MFIKTLHFIFNKESIQCLFNILLLVLLLFIRINNELMNLKCIKILIVLAKILSQSY